MNSTKPTSINTTFNYSIQYKRPFRRKLKRILVVLSFLAPAFSLYGVFLFYPMLNAIKFSFFEWDGASPTMNYVGLENYKNLFQDTVFYQALFHNVIWVVLSLILIVVPTLILAVMISRVKKGKYFFRAGFYLPSVLSLVVVAVLWAKIYDPLMGPLNAFLKMLGLPSPNWLAEEWSVLPALIVVGVWAFYGFYMILYLAGLQNLDYSLYEAAEIDGAGQIRKFWSVTIPGLRNTMNVVISMAIIHAFKAFALVWVMTRGGPYYKSELVSTYVYKLAFSMNKVGYGTVAGLVLGVIVITLTILFNYLRERGD